MAEASQLAAGDVLLLRDTPEGLRDLATTFAADLFERTGAGRFIEPDVARAETSLAEVVVGSQSELNGKTLKDARFAEQHQVVVVGLSRGTGGLLRSVSDIASTPLSAGDVLLVQGAVDQIDSYAGDKISCC